MSSMGDPPEGSGGPTDDRGSHNDPDTMSVQSENGDMKRAAAQLIEKYYFQLTIGCGNPHCDNPHCASKVGPLSSNEAAGKALQLFAARARLCGESGAKVTSDSSSSQSVASAASTAPHCANLLTETTTSTIAQAASCTTVPQDVTMAPAPPTPPPHPLNIPIHDVPENNIPVFSEEILTQIIQECKNANNYAKLRCLLWGVFSNEVSLRQCFIKKHDIGSPKDISQKCVLEKGNVGCSKEELRAQEVDLDKDLDCAEVLSEAEGAAAVCKAKENKLSPQQNIGSGNKSQPHTLDISSLHRTYEALFQCPEEEFASTLMSAISRLLSDSLSIQLRVYRESFNANPNNINIFLILLENPAINSVEYIEGVLPELCSTVSQLGVREQGVLVRHMAAWEPTRLRRLLESLHQLITIKLLTTEFTREFTINDETTITNATQVMKLLYYSSILGGELDLPLLKDMPPEDVNMESIPLQDDPFLGITGTGKDLATRTPPVDALGSVLEIHTLDARIPVIPLSEFYDDFLSDQLEMDRDFAYYKAGSGDKFSFLHFPFVLTPATKALGLYYDNRIRMYSERRMSIYQTLMDGMPANPYLKLRIRRDHIIDDSLVELEMVALENPGDLKKQLVVEFEGEQGIDEGGVSKEFFQLIVEQIFNPDYAMFILYEETQTYWFNPSSFESDAQFTLVGIIVGLAIYNTIILDVHFPPVMYKKLCSKPGSFHDLKDWNTTLYRTLCELLEYDGSDMEDVFMQTFKVGYQDAFGASLSHELKAGGDNVFVNQNNKQEFVSMYADFLLNKVVDRQFRAFRRGFNMVTDDSPLNSLFRPEELELLVCGSQQYDFMELMKSTEYDGGYSSESTIIQQFWELVHDLPEDDKKKLLQFTTGSARVPVGGLARLKLIIARHGPDTDRLPTAHTCFNVLLLPEYSSKEKLKDRLYKAIKYSQGFGML